MREGKKLTEKDRKINRAVEERKRKEREGWKGKKGRKGNTGVPS